MEREVEGEREGALEKHGRPKKAVDWVALIDEVWTSDNEDVPKCQGKSKSIEKVLSSGSSEASVDEQDHKKSKSRSRLEENLLEAELYPRSKILKEGNEPTCPLEDHLTDRGDDSPPCTCTAEPSILKPDQTSHQLRRTRQTDLLSFIDHKYSLANRSPLTDVENSTHSDSTDDGYMTSDNSRVDFTPQLPLLDTDSDALQHPNPLLSHRSTTRYWKFKLVSRISPLNLKK